MRKHLHLAAAAALALTGGAEAREFRVLYSNIGAPVSVLPDGAGRLYVPTYSGGAKSRGSVIRLDGDGNPTTLYDFKDRNGPANPSSRLLRNEDGELFGVASRYGTDSHGTAVYRISHGRETTLHFFSDGSNGCGGTMPGLVRDASGNLYGTSCNGGANGTGSVFKIAADGTASVLHSFSGADGRWAPGDLLLDAQGNLFGTTFLGGALESGTIFRIAADGTFKTLHSFDAWKEGCQVWGGLVADGNGNLYGTTNYAGPNADGTVFKLNAKGKLSVLHAFPSSGTDGMRPWGTLVRDAKTGALYGTTQQGGEAGGGITSSGTVFKLAPGGKMTVLHAFSGGEDGGMPTGELSMDAAGNLYGTTVSGGKVFEIVR